MQIPTLPTWANKGMMAEFDRKLTPGGKNRLKKVSVLMSNIGASHFHRKKISLVPEFCRVFFPFYSFGATKRTINPTRLHFHWPEQRLNITFYDDAAESKLSWKISLRGTDKLF